jgi:hypothetical protein
VRFLAQPKSHSFTRGLSLLPNTCRRNRHTQSAAVGNGQHWHALAWHSLTRGLSLLPNTSMRNRHTQSAAVGKRKHWHALVWHSLTHGLSLLLEFASLCRDTVTCSLQA